MSETMLYHAGKQMVEIPEIIVTKYTKDFSWGFYCTKDLTQAIRWANRGFGEPVVNKYEYHEAGNLKKLVFDKMTDDWLDFIAACWIFRCGETACPEIWKPAIRKMETDLSAAKPPLRQMGTDLPERGTADKLFA